MENKKKTIFIEMKCCKCHKSLGEGIFNEIIDSNSFLPSVNKIAYSNKITLDLYCDKCFVKEVLNIDL